MSTVEKRSVGDRERYLVRYRDEEGRSRARTFTQQAQAERWRVILDAAGPAVALAAYTDPAVAKAAREGLTVAEWTRRHIDALTGVTEGTKSDYLSYLRRDIAPGLGPLPLPALTREGVAKWVNAMAAGRTVAGDKRPPLSGKSIRNRHSLLSAAMTAAVREGYIAANPCKGIRLPRTDHLKAEMVVLSHEEQERLLLALAARWRPLVFTLLRTGMRWGEATALQVMDVRIEDARQTIRVRQAWKHTDSKRMELGAPKSRRGTRSIAMTTEVAQVLTPLLAGRRGDDLVFTAPRGGPVRQASFYDDVWSKAVVAAGLSPAPRVHDLRHTNASSLIATGVPLYNLSLHLGHESIATTADVYGHLMPDAHNAMTAAMQGAFRPSAVLAVSPALPGSPARQLAESS